VYGYEEDRERAAATTAVAAQVGTASTAPEEIVVPGTRGDASGHASGGPGQA